MGVQAHRLHFTQQHELIRHCEGFLADASHRHAESLDGRRRRAATGSAGPGKIPGSPAVCRSGYRGGARCAFEKWEELRERRK
jgi:hypothetical protein